jgi:hypothetical protein
MEQRMNFYGKGYRAMKPLFSLGAFLNKSFIKKTDGFN